MYFQVDPWIVTNIILFFVVISLTLGYFCFRIVMTLLDHFLLIAKISEYFQMFRENRSYIGETVRSVLDSLKCTETMIAYTSNCDRNRWNPWCAEMPINPISVQKTCSDNCPTGIDFNKLAKMDKPVSIQKRSTDTSTGTDKTCYTCTFNEGNTPRRYNYQRYNDNPTSPISSRNSTDSVFEHPTIPRNVSINTPNYKPVSPVFTCPINSRNEPEPSSSVKSANTVLACITGAMWYYGTTQFIKLISQLTIKKQVLIKICSDDTVNYYLNLALITGLWVAQSLLAFKSMVSLIDPSILVKVFDQLSASCERMIFSLSDGLVKNLTELIGNCDGINLKSLFDFFLNQNPNSMFSSILKSTGESNSDMLSTILKNAGVSDADLSPKIAHIGKLFCRPVSVDKSNLQSSSCSEVNVSKNEECPKTETSQEPETCKKTENSASLIPNISSNIQDMIYNSIADNKPIDPFAMIGNLLDLAKNIQTTKSRSKTGEIPKTMVDNENITETCENQKTPVENGNIIEISNDGVISNGMPWTL